MNPSLELNRANWDERAPLHAASPGYEVECFVQSATHLSEVVRFDLPRLGNIQGLKTLHLQCHIGTDTLSLARLGAQVSGLDFSPASLAQARLLAERCGVEIDYVEADVYRASEVLPKASYDLIYTGIGALCWLPDIQRWAQNVAALLKPGGRLFLREGHPMLWTLDETHADRLQVDFPYFEHEAPVIFHSDQTYVESEHRLAQTETHSWNRGLGEIITALLEQGMQLTALVEHRSIPWEALPGQMLKGEDGEWRLAERPERLPLSYTLQARKG